MGGRRGGAARGRPDLTAGTDGMVRTPVGADSAELLTAALLLDEPDAGTRIPQTLHHESPTRWSRLAIEILAVDESGAAVL